MKRGIDRRLDVRIHDTTYRWKATEPMDVHTFDPTGDPRYAELLAHHPRSTVFHTPGWLRALQRTYAYRPCGWTTARPGEAMRAALVACEVSSWLTGRRLVSLPFADHADPLADDLEEQDLLLEAMRREDTRAFGRYAEIRWRHLPEPPSRPAGWDDSESFAFHQLDLSGNPDDLLASFHKTAIRQPIRRAEREGLIEECGRDRRLLDQFYALLLLTRRKHGLPPQPRRWFSHLVEELGEAIEICVASKRDRPVAAIVTCRHGDKLYYKYGASDPKVSNLGGTPFLLWRAIRKGQATGLRALDMGRSDAANEGLIRFKDRWGAQRSALVYQRTTVRAAGHGRAKWPVRVAHGVFGRMPDKLLTAAGGMLYRHMG